MKQKIIIILILIAGLTGFIAEQANSQPDYDKQWPSFRGPRACGYLTDSRTPSGWDMESKKGIRWKTPVPGLAHSSPVIWGNLLFVT